MAEIVENELVTSEQPSENAVQESEEIHANRLSARKSMSRPRKSKIGDALPVSIGNENNVTQQAEKYMKNFKRKDW